MSVDLDLELVQHLVRPDNVLILREEGINPDHVFNKKVKGVAQFVWDYMHKYGKPPTSVVLQEEWTIEEGKPELDPEYLAERLKRRYVRSRQKRILEDLIQTEEPQEFVDTLVQHGHQLWSQVAPTRHILTGDDYKALLEEFKSIADRNERGATLGFDEVDEHTGGAGKGHLIFYVARPKRYKSWFLLKAFVEQRLQGLTPVLFTLELSEKDMYKRLMCLVSGVSYSRMMKNTLMPSEWRQIEEAMEAFSSLGPYYIVHPPFDQRKVSSFVLEVEKKKADVALIDQLSFIHPEKNQGRSDENTKEIVHSMKVAATKQQIPYICVCQFNREAAALEDMAGADKIGLSRSIEETADLLLALHRNEDEAERNIIRLRILEGRYCKSNAAWTVKVNLQNHTAFAYDGQVLQRTAE